MLEHGLGGVKENLRRAEFWYNQAAKKDHATAQCFLGLFHIKDEEYNSARFWLERAARQGHARAQMHFGLLYEHSRDFQTAKFWYRMAVNQGDAKAECRLDFLEGKRRQGTPDAGLLKELSHESDQPEASTQKKPVSPTTGRAVLPDTTMRDSKRMKGEDVAGIMEVTSTEESTKSSPSSSQRGSAQSRMEMENLRMEIVKPQIANAVAKASRTPQVYAPDVIRPYCAVMGDKSTRGARLTMGTKVLREIKEWFKENRVTYQESGRESSLFEEAMQRYFARMTEIFDDFPRERAAQEETILVKCTKKSLESDRVAKPNCYRYSSESQCQYGTAKLPHAVLFYFDSRDPPKLDAEVTKYKRKLGARPDLQGKRREYFQGYLDFCASTASQAADGCPSAQLAVESTNFIPALKKLWDDLERSKDCQSC